MKRPIFILMIAIFAFAVVPASAQLGSLKKIATKKNSAKPEKKKDSTNKTSSTSTQSRSGKSVNKDLPHDPNHYYIGANDLLGKSVGELVVCADPAVKGVKLNWEKEFKEWRTGSSDRARIKSFKANYCGLLGYALEPDRRGYKYRKVEDLKAVADGLSVYQVEKGALKLIKSFSAATFYVAVAQGAAKPNLTMNDLVLCMHRDFRSKFRKKVKSSYANCYSTKDKVNFLSEYKKEKNPTEWTGNSVLLTEEDFKTESKKGTFKNEKIYKVVGEKLIPN